MDTVYEPARQTPVAARYDVVVCGGGIAGVAAALAAARRGAAVCLVEKQCLLGGLATAGLVAIYLPLCDGRGHQLISGIGEELLLLSVRDDAHFDRGIPDCWRPGGDPAQRALHRYATEFNPWRFAMAMEDLLLSQGVTLYYDTHVCAVTGSPERVDAVIVENKSGRLALGAAMVVDATGDADVFHLAGERTATSAVNRLAAWYYSADEGDAALHPLAVPLYDPLPAGRRFYDGTRGEDVSAMLIDSRRMLREDLDRRRQQAGRDIRLTAFATMAPMRMTRRLVGRRVLDVADERQVFADSVGMTGDWRHAGPIFPIPYGSLIGERVGNVIAAGRCISATEAMADITRVIPPCAVTGQAAGTAAVLAAGKGIALQDVDAAALAAVLVGDGVLMEKELPPA